jgi:hypothetical protein
MVNREQGVPGDHPGARVAHHLGDSFSHVGFVAVNCALGAGALVFAERAPVQTLLGIILEFLAGGTKLPSACPMMSFAKHPYHDGYRLSFLFQVVHRDKLS